MMSIQFWKESFQGGESISIIMDKEFGIKPRKIIGFRYYENHRVDFETKSLVCGKGIINKRLSKIWCTFEKAASLSAYAFLQVHYGLSHFFQRTAKKIAGPNFESKVDFILGFTFGLGIVAFCIILSTFALYGYQIPYFFFHHELAEPVLLKIKFPLVP